MHYLTFADFRCPLHFFVPREFITTIWAIKISFFFIGVLQVLQIFSIDKAASFGLCLLDDVGACSSSLFESIWEKKKEIKIYKIFYINLCLTLTLIPATFYNLKNLKWRQIEVHDQNHNFDNLIFDHLIMVMNFKLPKWIKNEF
ncbi:hypothetical protein BpHYR1_042745 [Brachionus plicatilis]|uniref:Uncharacterized protein n=1 Tax=Brachionus plicatilis TaxID=10195 RepID=A0A3M7PSM5_BRAPC|nr:hypothetical protein BpHYR1_042745 [Brachionus plicatilis]